MAVMIRSRRGPGTTPGTTQGAVVKGNPEACGPQNSQGVPTFRLGRHVTVLTSRN